MTCRWPRSFFPSSELVRDTGDQLADGRELFALHELGFERLLLGDVFDHDDDAVLGRGAGNPCHVHAQGAAQRLGARDERGRPFAAARRRQELVQRVRFAEQRAGKRGADDVLQRHPEEARERAVGAPHAAFVVDDGNALAQRVERRLPLVLGAPHHLEEAGVRDHHGGMGGERGEEPDVFRNEHPFTGIGDEERADDRAV